VICGWPARRRDLIDSPSTRTAVTTGGLQQFEWKRFLTDYGSTVKKKTPIGASVNPSNSHATTGRTSKAPLYSSTDHRANKTRSGRLRMSPPRIALFPGWGPVHLINWGCSWVEGEKRRDEASLRRRGEVLRVPTTRILAEPVGERQDVRDRLSSYSLDARKYDWPRRPRAYYDKQPGTTTLSPSSWGTLMVHREERRWDGRRKSVP